MNWRIRLIGIAYDLIVGSFSGLALLWFILLTAVPNGWLALLLVPVVILIFFVSVFFHELGHLIAASAMGLEVLVFASWPLKIVGSPKGFYLRHFDLPAPMLGLVAAYPRSLRFVFRKLEVLLCAGPLVNLLVAVVSLNLAYNFNENPYWIASWQRLLVPRNWEATVLFAIGLVNLYFFFVSLRPIPFKRFRTDAAALIAIGQAPQLAVQTWLAEALSAASRNGIRPRELNREFIDYLLASRDGSAHGVFGNFFGYYVFLDKGQTDRAGELIDLLIANREKYPPVHQPYVVFDAAYFEARHRHNAPAARRWLDQVPKDGVEAQTYLRAEAAVLLAEGRYKEAAVIARAALIVLPKSADPGGAIAEKEWLESILTESQRKIDEAPRT